MLYPSGGVRQTPIQAVIITDAELDHTLGLLLLREGSSLPVYMTPWVYQALNELNPILPTLRAFCEVDWQPALLNEQILLRNRDGHAAGLSCTAFSTLSTKAVAFARGAASHPESTVGYRIRDEQTGQTLVYMPGVQAINDQIKRMIEPCTCLLFDGTCWNDDELAQLGISQKTARMMGHLPIDGPDGSLAYLSSLVIERKLYIHINNTNPVLRMDSPERKRVEEQGIAIAMDGMEFEI
ncbi:MAG: pyrroloquinoline quinone biosynthesis protein PqqB [Herpetosiphon sp.]